MAVRPTWLAQEYRHTFGRSLPPHPGTLRHNVTANFDGTGGVGGAETTYYITGQCDREL
jgi:hypothetical protein